MYVYICSYLYIYVYIYILYKPKQHPHEAPIHTLMRPPSGNQVLTSDRQRAEDQATMPSFFRFW